ncbi:DgyrCDS2689 [Dimorphilus gyrociliatus]|uniref:DgyrCDS2689 n=1 Tax=Dimorphilus gyrociliatus TaxID=2664684 RepID=A0A7I8VB77_9ANNE|nr:DgyrCDS2689 [Dimorphilus gyrociliatus]
MDSVRSQYRLFNRTFVQLDIEPFPNESSPLDWTEERFKHVMQLKQEAIDVARNKWADFFMVTDADAILSNPNTLKILISQQRTIVSPMLNITGSNTYSNFWCGMDENGYYQRTPDYLPILFRHHQGCFDVPMVHSVVLIDLRRKESNFINFLPKRLDLFSDQIDDIIYFAQNNQRNRIKMHIVNTDYFGWMTAPLDARHQLTTERLRFEEMLLQVAAYTDSPLEGLSYLAPERGPRELLNFDKIYIINLKRRPDRMKRMKACMDILNINYTRIEAFDGRELSESRLKELGVQMLDGYKDPYGERPLTLGEIGCFLSHYVIWKDIVEKGYERVLIFEDDVRFKNGFKQNLFRAIKAADSLSQPWDLIYLGRKRLQNANEYTVSDDIPNLVWVDYTYWTISYALSESGARKLIGQNPLSKMIAVDEYLPIMYDKHPNEEWKSHFEPRDLVALSAEPLLLEPTHYTGEMGYITDTENSRVVDDEELKAETLKEEEERLAQQTRGENTNVRDALGSKSRLFGDL